MTGVCKAPMRINYGVADDAMGMGGGNAIHLRVNFSKNWRIFT